MSATANSSLQLSEYLENLQGTTFRRLYQQPSTAFAIFRRMLPHLAKTIVMAILYMPTPFLLSDLEIWVKPSAKRQKDQALSILRSLHIIVTVPSRDALQSMTLRPEFKTSLRLALEGGGDHNSFGVPSKLSAPSHVDLPFLDKYARKKWDDILYYVVNSVGLNDSSASSGEGGSGPKASVKELLIAGRLVERKPSTTKIIITQSGFTFLLQEANLQVWTLLLLWLETTRLAKESGVDTGGMDHVDMLSFLFLLASLELGRGYSTGALTEPRRNMLPALADFGLVYIPTDKQYFPTRLATTLTSSESSLRSVSAGFVAASEGGVGDAQDMNAIILETNFRVYGYTSSPLQIAVLALFCDLKMRFRELVSGKLTRQSIRRAVDMGITSEQIISYLATHAHEQMHRVAASTKKPLLPPVIVDQIRLWQLDTERMSTTTGVLFKEFDSIREYRDTVTFADEIGVLAWRSDTKGMFFAHQAGFNQVKDFLKNRKKAEKFAAEKPA